MIERIPTPRTQVHPVNDTSPPACFGVFLSRSSIRRDTKSASNGTNVFESFTSSSGRDVHKFPAKRIACWKMRSYSECSDPVHVVEERLSRSIPARETFPNDVLDADRDPSLYRSQAVQKSHRNRPHRRPNTPENGVRRNGVDGTHERNVVGRSCVGALVRLVAEPQEEWKERFDSRCSWGRGESSPALLRFEEDGWMKPSRREEEGSMGVRPDSFDHPLSDHSRPRRKEREA